MNRHAILQRAKHSRWTVISLLVLVPLLVFARVATQSFLTFDDDINIYGNPYLNPITASNLGFLWTHAYQALYVPVTYTVWAGVAAVARLPEAAHVIGVGVPVTLDARYFHAANLLVHLLNVLLVWCVLRRVVASDWAAGAGALLFAIHPVQVEPVAWATGMKDLLGTLLSLLALWQFAEYMAANNAKALRLAFALIAYALALLAKPSAVAVPAMAWCLGTYALAGDPRRGRQVLLCSFLALPLIAFTQHAQPVEPGLIVPWFQRPLVAADALAFYCGKLMMPLNLAMDYGHTPKWVLAQGATYILWIVPAGIACLLWRERRRRPRLFAAGCIFLLGLLPTIGLVPYGFEHLSTVTDRYLYPAMLGPALLLAVALGTRHQARYLAVAGVALACLGALCFRQVRVWDNDFTLFTHAAQVNPDSYFAQDSLGDAYSNEHQYALAAQHYRRSAELNPTGWHSFFQLGVALAQLQDNRGALAALQKAAELHPKDAGIQNALGAALCQGNDWDAAIPHFRAALAIDPGNGNAYNNLQWCLAMKNSTAEARRR